MFALSGLVSIAGFAVASGSGGAGPLAPCNPQPDPITNVVIQTNPTNATLNWDQGVGETDTLSWGNTTNPYPFSQPAQPYTQPGGAVNFSVFLNFLEPSKTYYFKIYAPATKILNSPLCFLSSTYTTSKSTPSDTWTWITGKITDPSNGVAPHPMYVWVTCLRFPTAYGGGIWDQVATTNSNGVFNLTTNEYSPYYPHTCSNSGYVIQVLNSVQADGGLTTKQWEYHWNMTLVLWAEQTVSFRLPWDYNSKYLPTIFDYTNAPAAQGYTDFNAATSAAVSESYTYSWTAGAQIYGISGGASGSQSSSQTWSWESNIGENEGTLCYAQIFNVTGTGQFNALDRHWSFDQTYFHGHSGDFCYNIVGFTMPQPWIHNSTANGAYYLPGQTGGLYQNGLRNVTLWKGEHLGNATGFTLSGTLQTGLQFGLGLSFALPGAPSVSATVSETWSQTVSQSVSWSFTLYGESQTAVSCYNVLGAGGSQSSNDATAIAVYYWQGYTKTINGQIKPFCN